MLKNFVRVWLAYWLAVALLPVHSLYPATTAALALQASFVLLVAASYASVRTLSGIRGMPSAGAFDIPAAPSVIRAAIVMSLIGLAALTYDKLVVQGIDYSEGVAVAREEWRRLGEEREGEASSVFSVIGYLLGSAYYVVLVLAITQTRVLTTRERVWALIACFVLMMANSALTGGRSNVLLLGAFAVSAFSARRGLSLRKLFTGPAQRRLIKLLVGLAFAYTVFIFYERAQAGDESALEYAIDFLPFLGVEADLGYRAMLDGGALSSLSAMLVLALSYITHSFATVAAIIDGPPEDKTIILLHAMSILHKLGLAAAPDGDWFLSGRLPSVPGALWHQFGALGFALGSMFFGALAALAMVWSAHRPKRLLPLGAFVLTDTTLLLSPALFAGDFLSFPFVVASFVMLATWARMRGRPCLRQQAVQSSVRRAT